MKIDVLFKKDDVGVATVVSEIKAGIDEQALYVLGFDDGRRMLVGFLTEADGPFLELGIELKEGELLCNPCGGDIAEDLGLGSAAFDVQYEGGLFQVKPHVDALAAGAKQLEGR